MRSILLAAACVFVVLNAVSGLSNPPPVSPTTSNSLRNYVRNYTLPDLSKVLDLLKDEKIQGKSEASLLFFGTSTEKSKPWAVLSKIDALFDQIIILWKDFGAVHSVDVSEKVHTVFDAKYEVQELILASRGLFEKAKNDRSNNLKISNALKKDALSKIDLATDVVKRVVDDLVMLVQPFDNSAEEKYYQNLVGNVDARK